MTTALYAALLALFYIVLSFKVVGKRRQFRIGIGSNGEIALERAIRVHGNFAEYVPFALLLMFLAEYSGLAAVYLHILGCVLLVGRLSHAWGVRQVQEPLKFRVFGMMLTMSVLLLSAVSIIVLFVSRATV